MKSVDVGDQFFHDKITYYNREYWVDEVHDLNKLKGKWFIHVQVPGVNHDPKIFTISVRGYDNEPDNDAFNDKRPALFYTLDDARKFCDNLHFLKSALRATCLTESILNHKIFKEMGGYLIKISNIIIPSKTVDLGEIIKESRETPMPAYDDPGGIFLV